MSSLQVLNKVKYINIVQKPYEMKFTDGISELFEIKIGVRKRLVLKG